MTREELSMLAQKYLLGETTVEERRLLQDWYEDQGGEEELIAEIPAMDGENAETLERRMRERLSRGLGFDAPKVYRLRPFLRVAAVVLLTGAVATTVYYAQRPLVAVPQMAPVQDVAPGSQKAVLTLANGSSVLLDSNRNVELARQGSASVRQVKGGALAYHAPVGETSAEVLYNTLSVPRGGQYQLELPDGSKVWLNASSSIRYPVSFTGKDRAVEVTGEAYFEIAPEPGRPFKVKVGDREVINVLGTHFNVNAYEDEEQIRTTLLEGKVNVSSGSQTESLDPGQDVATDRSGKMLVNGEADLEAAVAWKNGLFVFDKEDIGSIMRQVSRWYNVTVGYEGNMQGKGFTGQISRYANVSQVLHMLELTQDIHFKIDGDRITVLP